MHGVFVRRETPGPYDPSRSGTKVDPGVVASCAITQGLIAGSASKKNSSSRFGLAKPASRDAGRGRRTRPSPVRRETLGRTAVPAARQAAISVNWSRIVGSHSFGRPARSPRPRPARRPHAKAIGRQHGQMAFGAAYHPIPPQRSLHMRCRRARRHAQGDGAATGDTNHVQRLAHVGRDLRPPTRDFIPVLVEQGTRRWMARQGPGRHWASAASTATIPGDARPPGAGGMVAGTFGPTRRSAEPAGWRRAQSRG
jgi:hypothetical protein